MSDSLLHTQGELAFRQVHPQGLTSCDLNFHFLLVTLKIYITKWYINTWSKIIPKKCRHCLLKYSFKTKNTTIYVQDNVLLLLKSVIITNKKGDLPCTFVKVGFTGGVQREMGHTTSTRWWDFLFFTSQVFNFWQE